MKRTVFSLMAAAIAGGVLVTTGSGEPSKSAPQVELNAASADVSQSENITVTGTAGTQVVLLVRAATEDEPWWVQNVLTIPESGSAQVAARFGNEQTPDGTAYDVLAMRADADQPIEVGQTFAGVDKSDRLSVLLSVTRRVEVDEHEENVVAVTESAVGEEVSDEAPAEPTSPEEQVVGRSEVVSVEIPEGRSVVALVRPAESEQEWYVQEIASVEGTATATLRFGNDKTPEGAEFEYVILSTPSANESAAGTVLADLPEDGLVLSRHMVRRGETLTGAVADAQAVPEVQAEGAQVDAAEQPVVDKSEAGAEQGTGRRIILSPVPNARVQANHLVVGRRIVGREPVVLVKPAGSDNGWYVQPLRVISNDRFAAEARFGNERTPEGTKFEVSVALFEQNPGWQPGDFVKTLPEGVERSRLIEVERASLQTARRTGAE